MENVNSLATWIQDQFDPALSWKDVEWIKKIWPGKLIIKGILDPEDAKTAVKLGADAIVVSNHGGRQLDGAPSSISALPAVAQAVGSDTEVLFDGGIRTGADIMRALALGARACLIGRAYVYGLGAGGKAGCSQGDRHSQERTQRHHGADRHQPHCGHRTGRARRRRGEEEGGAEAEGEGGDVANLSAVMAGLDPAISLRDALCSPKRDHRDEPGDDAGDAGVTSTPIPARRA